MIFIDSNVFVIALRYPRDRTAKENERFLKRIQARGDGTTSVVNVLEVCGVLSFNLNERQLRNLFSYFGRRFGISVVPEERDEQPIVAATHREILKFVASRLSFGDSLVADAIERWAPVTETFVSWDATHFRGKIAPLAVTPRQFLTR